MISLPVFQAPADSCSVQMSFQETWMWEAVAVKRGQQSQATCWGTVDRRQTGDADTGRTRLRAVAPAGTNYRLALFPVVELEGLSFNCFQVHSPAVPTALSGLPAPACPCPGLPVAPAQGSRARQSWPDADGPQQELQNMELTCCKEMHDFVGGKPGLLCIWAQTLLTHTPLGQ